MWCTTSYCYYNSLGVFISKVRKLQIFFFLVVQASWVVKDRGWQGSSSEPTIRAQRHSSRTNKNLMGHLVKSRVLEKPHLSTSLRRKWTGSVQAPREKENGMTRVQEHSRTMSRYLHGLWTFTRNVWATPFPAVKSCSVDYRMVLAAPSLTVIPKTSLCMYVQLCLTLCDPMDGSPLGSSVHEIL